MSTVRFVARVPAKCIGTGCIFHASCVPVDKEAYARYADIIGGIDRNRSDAADRRGVNRTVDDRGWRGQIRGWGLADRCTHVGRDLCLRQRAAVNSQVVDTAGKIKAGVVRTVAQR